MKRLLLTILFFTVYTSLSAFQWPIAGGFLTASFGENNSDSFLKGIRISGHGSVVSPFLDGELIYYSSEFDHKAPVLGNVKVLHHENGFRSVYGHMEPFFDEPEELFLTENDQLGLVGDSGHSYEKSLFFMIYDTKMNQYVNPQIILPPSGDTASPEIESVSLHFDDRIVALGPKNRLEPGIAHVYARIVDSDGISNRSIETVPYSLTMFYLGNEINQIKFDTLKEENGELILKGGHPVSFENLYSGDSIYLGQISLTRGIAYLEISASDITGNNAIKTYQLNID